VAFNATPQMGQRPSKMVQLFFAEALIQRRTVGRPVSMLQNSLSCMRKGRMMKKIAALILVLALVFTFGPVACEKEGPAEKAGKKVDETMEKAADKAEEAGDAIENEAEEADKKIDETMEKASDKAEEAGDAIKNKMDDAKEEVEKKME
jgi:hypothetical protein